MVQKYRDQKGQTSPVESVSQSHPLSRNPLFSKFSLPLILLLAACATLPYLNTFENEFVFDDCFIVETNPLVIEPIRIGKIFTTNYWGEIQKIGNYRPFTILSYNVNAFLGYATPSPVLFHLMNLLLHLANTLVLFLLLSLLFRRPFAAFVPSLLFALHPIHTEAVTNIVGRAELLSALFSLLSIFFFIRCLTPFHSGRFLLSLLFYTMGLFSKENSLTLLGLLPLYGIFFHKGVAPTKKSHRQWLVPFLFFLIPTLFYLWIRTSLFGLPWKIHHGFEPEKLKLINPIFGAAFFPRLWTCAYVFGRYVLLLLFPVNLSADYSHQEIPLIPSPWTEGVLIPIALFALSIALVPLLWKKKKALLFGLGWFFVSFSIVSNLVFSTGTIMGERLLYLPSAGFCILLAAPFVRLLEGKRHRKAAISVLLISLALHGYRTFERNRDWKDNLTLFEKTSQTSPLCARAWSNLGWCYFEKGRELADIDRKKSRANLEKAAWATDKSISLQVPSLRMRINRAKISFHLEEYERAAREHQAILENPGESTSAHLQCDLLVTLAEALFRTGRKKEALDILERAQKIMPDDPSIQRAYRKILR